MSTPITFVIGDIKENSGAQGTGNPVVEFIRNRSLSNEARRALIVPGQIITEDMLRPMDIHMFKDRGYLQGRFEKPVTINLTDGRALYIRSGRVWGYPPGGVTVVFDHGSSGHIIPAPQVAGRRRSTRKTRRGRRSTRRRQHS
jgi:hypothetical protein